MLIKRIIAIKQVGGFYNFGGGGALPFSDQGHNLTVVFGRNTYGKSTLAEIMSSLGRDDPALLDARESIPSDAGIARLVELNYLASDGTEQSAKLTSAWSSNELTGNIDVFDEDFVHRNLITGNKIVRENHEYFTDFILGEEGVQLSNRIETLKRTIRQKRGALSGLRPPYVSGASEADVGQFVKLVVTETDELLAREREDHERSLRGMTEADKFLALPELPGDAVDVSDAVSEIIESSSLMLRSGYRDVTESVQTTIQNHIDRNCAGDTGAMRWIKTGRTYTKSGVCPFCGGELSAGNQDLLAAYGRLFNEAFEAHDVRIQAEIQKIKAEVARLGAVNAPNAILRLVEAAMKFDEFVPGLQEDIAALNEMLASVVDAQETVSGRLTDWDEALSPLLALKQQAPQREVEKELDEGPLRAAVAVLSGEISVANEVVLRAKGRIVTSKAPLAERDREKEEREVRSVGEKIKAIEMKRARLAQEQQCVDYTEAVGEVARLDDELGVLNSEFETDQSRYIERYFANMNELFSELGSKEFKIHATSSQRGDKKIYALSVKYRGKTVTGDKLAKTLSESDKRSLALALFVTKANTQAKKSDRILVLDDPVVSFDDNRIDVSCTLFNRLASEFGHVIVITHYMSVIRRLINMRVDATYVEAYKTADSCVLRRFDAEAEARDAHEKAFEEISEKIADGGAGGDDRLLRVFFEEHVHLVFQRQIKSEGLEGLQFSDLIDGLLEKGVISEDVARRSHEYRLMFNPDHHMTSGFNPAEWCVNSGNLLDFIFGSLHADKAA